MDKFERRRDRYSGGGEEAHHYNSGNRRGFPSSRFPEDGSPFSEHRDESYRGGGGGGRNSPRSYRSGGDGGGGREHRRPFDSPPRYPPPPGGGDGGRAMRPIGDGIGGIPPMAGYEGGGFRPMVGGSVGGFRPMSGDDGGFAPVGGSRVDGGGFWPIRGYNDDIAFRPMGGGGGDFGVFPPDNYLMRPPPLSGQKRGYPFSGRERSPDRFVSTGFTKLFVGSVPRTATEADIRPLFDNHGRVLEVALIKDKRTGQQQGCCFVKYASSEEADRAIRALHNQYTLPGGIGPIQVRYADGERERLGTTEYKLFVGSLNKQANEHEVEEIFSPYGRVEDVYLMRDEMKQSRGCGFVKYSQREMAQAAINALNGTYTMRGCDQPLIVRFADPKRPRPGERGGPGFAPRPFAPVIRPALEAVEHLRQPIAPNSWPPISPPDLGPPSSGRVRGIVDQLPSRSGDMTLSATPGPFGGLPGNAEGSHPGPTTRSPTEQNSTQPLPQDLPFGSKISPSQRPFPSPQNMPSSLQLQPPTAASYPNMENLYGSRMQPGQVQLPYSAGQVPYGHTPPSQHLVRTSGQISVSQPQVQHNAMAAPGLAPGAANQQRQPAQLLQPLQQSPSHLAQMLSQQKQTLQATFQSSQQAFNQLQQQVQQLQPSTQSAVTHQGPHVNKHQPPWAGMGPQSVVNTPGVQSADLAPITSVSPTVPTTTPAVATIQCNWTEHTAPDGYKYYYNSSTGESKWEKPEELTLYEKQQQQQQQKPANQNPQVQSRPQGHSTQHAPQMQVQLQGQHHTQLQNQIRPLQQASQLSMYQNIGPSAKQNAKELSYAPISTGTGPANDPAYYRQGPQATQEWMWKNKPSGS